jgi:signal transduction histidine kinase
LLSPRHRLRRALVLALALGLLLPSLLAGGLLIYLNTQRTLVTEGRERAENFANLLQAGLASALWDVTPETSLPLIQAVSADPAVVSIDVRDAQGQTFVAQQKPGAEHLSPDAVLTIQRQVKKDGELIGRLSLGYSTAPAVERAQAAAWLLLVVVGCQLGVSLWLVRAWMARRVLGPLEQLRTSAERIAQGDLDTPVAALGGDELGVLAQRLDAMRLALAQSVGELEHRVHLRTADLQHSNQQLTVAVEQLNQAHGKLVQSEKLASLGALVAGVAHELNTPIGTGVTVTSTLGEVCSQFRAQLVQGLRRADLDAFVLKVEQGAALALSSLTRAAELVQQFKKMSVDQTSGRRRPFALSEVWAEAQMSVRLRYKHTQHQITFEPAPNATLDSYPGALMQVLTNLIDNAMLHAFAADEAGHVGVRAWPEGQYVWFEVKDNGQGIAPEHMKQIFDPFFTTRMGSGGSGLGLSIVHNLVVGLLGGEVVVDSDPGTGTRFGFSVATVAPALSEAVA